MNVIMFILCKYSKTINQHEMKRLRRPEFSLLIIDPHCRVSLIKRKVKMEKQQNQQTTTELFNCLIQQKCCNYEPFPRGKRHECRDKFGVSLCCVIG